MAAIAAMKPHTFMKGAEAPIFCHPATGRPWTNDQYQRITYFHPALRKLGIRLRDAYQTRHTYATIGLMGGIAPPYIARQMGHANTAMLFKVYAKWIDGADKGREAAKLAALHAPHSVLTPPIVPALSPQRVS
jgi:integrase